MARERIIVKEAINSLRNILKEVLREFSHRDEIDNPREIVFKSNLLSFIIRFLYDIPKVSDIISEIAKRLEGIGLILVNLANKELTNAYEDIINNEDVEDLYTYRIYPIARILEALGGVYSIINVNCIESAVDIITLLLSEESANYIFDANQKLVPIVQGLLKVANKLYNKDQLDAIEKTLDKVLALAMEEDPDISSIYTQDIYYLIKFQRNEYLSEEEMTPLYNNLASNTFKKVLKGIEYLSIFKQDPPQSSIDYVLSKLPLFFNEVFRIGDLNRSFTYFSSIAESIYNVLRFFNNKAFAQVIMNHLIEDTGWIARNDNNFIDFIKTVIGTSLLIHARSAIRR